MTDHETVEALVKQAKKGSESAVSELYQRYYPRVYYMALRRLADEDQAIEVTQETFLRVITKLDSLKNPRAFEKWIFTLANHEIIEAATQKTNTSVDFDALDAASSTEWLPDIGMDPEDQVQHREDRSKLLAAINQLSTKQRDVVVLHYFNDLSVAEIARVLAIPAATISKRLFDARAQLKSSLDDEAEATLDTALRQDAATYDYHPVGERLATRFAAVLPMLIGTEGLMADPLVRARAQSFLKSVSGQATPVAAPSSAPAMALSAKIALVAAAVLLGLGGAYALWRQAATPEPTTRKPHSQTITAASPVAPSEPATESAEASATSSVQGATETTPTVSSSSTQTQGAAEAAPARPVITVATSQLTWPCGAPPSTAEVLRAIGAAASDAQGNALPVTLSGLSAINFDKPGDAHVFVHATDGTGKGAQTVVITVTITQVN